MKFRNYLPHDKQLQEGKLAPVALPKLEDPVVVAPLEPQKAEDPFLNIAPKKPNWDLKRDVQKRLDKLEKRTKKALNELPLEQQREREASEAGDAMWLSSLSEPELDFLISLKELATMRSKFVGHRAIANKFDLRMLRALGMILLEHFKEKSKSILSHAIDADLIDKLPLLSSSTPVNVNLENPTPSFAALKRKYMHDGLRDIGTESSKKQKITVKEEPVEY